jgi:hypothetical protein
MQSVRTSDCSRPVGDWPDLENCVRSWAVGLAWNGNGNGNGRAWPSGAKEAVPDGGVLQTWYAVRYGRRARARSGNGGEATW